MSTHQQLLYHIVFSTKNRKHYLQDGIRDSVFSYMAATCEGLDGFAIKINGYFDHVHLLVRIRAKVAVSHFIGLLKASTSKHINDKHDRIAKFRWQDGYGAFSVSASQKDAVYRYIERQMEHHQRFTFRQEYVHLLDKHEIEYDDRYVFD